MTAFFRFLHILILALRYRLDLLIPNESLPRSARYLLCLCRLLPKTDLSRGERIRRFFEELGPVFIKFGQLLSTRPDLLPDDIATELARLQDDVPPFDAELSCQLVEKALGKPVEELFASFEREPMASASIAQVHAATLAAADGSDQPIDVVVKVIRPGLKKIIDKDIMLMHSIASKLERVSSDFRRLRPVEIVDDYQHTITDELNLAREAANASQLRRNFEHSPLLYIPEIYWDYTRESVMVMERISGIPVTDVAALEEQNTDMKLLAERGVEIFFTQVLEHNFFHADMHPGNIFVSRQHPRNPQYIAVDLAIVGSLTQADQYYLARNLLAVFKRDYRTVAELFLQSGWIDPSTPAHDFEAAVRTCCEPYFQKPLKDISFGQIVVNLFKTARRFDMEVQPQLVLLQKTLLNIEGLGRQLYPDLDLWQTAYPFLDRWVKSRFEPKTVLQQIRRHGPDLIEQMPNLPQSLLSGLDQAQRLSRLAPQLENIAAQVSSQQNRAPRHRRRLSIAILALIGSIAVAGAPMLTQLQQVPTASWCLLAIAGWMWFKR